MAHRQKGHVRVVIEESSYKSDSGAEESNARHPLVTRTYYKKQKEAPPRGSRKARKKAA